MTILLTDHHGLADFFPLYEPGSLMSLEEEHTSLAVSQCGENRW